MLVNAIEPATVACGATISPGVWYQSFSGGPRWAHISIVNAAGRTVWHKDVTAGSSWRYYRYKPACGQRYTVVYETAAGTTRFKVTVR